MTVSNAFTVSNAYAEYYAANVEMVRKAAESLGGGTAGIEAAVKMFELVLLAYDGTPFKYKNKFHELMKKDAS